MGHRTVVILFNDQMSEWQGDPELGRKIALAANHASASRDQHDRASIGYGRVVESAHADTQTLAVIDSYNMSALTHSFWQRGQSDTDVKLRLLRQAADELGYDLVQKPGKKPGKTPA